MKILFNKLFLSLIIVLLLINTLDPQITSFASKPESNELKLDSSPDRDSGEFSDYIIKYKNLSRGKEIVGSKTKSRVDINRFKLSRAKLNKKDVEALKKDNNIEYIEPDYGLEMSGEYDALNLKQVHIPEVHEKQYFGEGIKVAVLDTGIDKESTELSIAGGVSFVEDETDYDDLNGHGTMVAGIISAIKDDIGQVGVAPHVELYAVKVLDGQGMGSYSQVISAIEWAVANDMDIISMSFGGKNDSKALGEAIKYANDNGVLLIGAAGNSGTNDVEYPAKYDAVISVGAVDYNNQHAFFSNRGKVDLVAPGVNIVGLSLTQGDYWNANGTSFAVPHVVGVAALLKQAQPQLGLDQLKSALYSGAVPLGASNDYGHGLVNATRSLNQIGIEVEEIQIQNVENTLDLATLSSLTPVLYSVTDSVYNSVTQNVYSGESNSVTQIVYSDLSDVSISDYTPTIDLQKNIWNMTAKVDQAPFSINNNGESISTLSGQLTVEESDLSLPGRNGLSFTLSRSYDSSNAGFYKEELEPILFCMCEITYSGTRYQERTQDMVTIYQNPTSYISGTWMFNPSYSSFLNDQIYSSNLHNYILSKAGQQRAFASSWSGPDAYGFYTRDVWDVSNSPNLTYRDTNQYGSSGLIGWRSISRFPTQEDNLFPIGKGWSWNIPNIKKEQNKSFLSFPGKGTYEIVGSSLIGYPWQDLTIGYDASVTVNGVQSNTVLSTLDKKKYYFSSLGKLIQISDAYSNTIQFKYSPHAKYGEVLTHIVDAIGNDLQITYPENQVVLQLGDKKVTYWKSTWGEYNQFPPFNLMTVEYLYAVTNVLDQSTYYDYDVKDAKFSITTSTPEILNKQALLKTITYPSGAQTNYQFEPIPVNRYSSANSVHQVYRIKNRSDKANGTVYNSVSYEFPGDMGSSYNQDYNFSTVTDNGLLRTTYDYKKDYIDENTPAVFYNNKTTQAQTNPVIKKETTYTYDETRRLPIPNTTSTIVIKGTETSVPIELSNTYDNYGNTLTATDPTGTTTLFEYDPSTHLLSAITSPIDVNRKQYTQYARNTNGTITQLAEYEKNESGSIVKQQSQVNIDEIDFYGNPKVIRFKDTNRDIIKTYEYSSAYQYAYPTKEQVLVKDVNGVITPTNAQYEYFSSGLVSKVIDGEGYNTNYEYDKFGRLKKVTNHDTSYKTVDYNDFANTVRVTDETNTASQIKYNAIGLKTSEGVFNGSAYIPSITYSYDQYSRLDKQVDAEGRVVDYNYDNWGRTIERIEGTNKSSIEYDDIHLLQTGVDAENNKYKTQFDKMGRKLANYQIKNILGAPTDVMLQSLQYDMAGNVKQQVDANTNLTKFGYDVSGNLLSVINAKEEETKYTYSMMGMLTQIEYPDHTAVKKEYDELGRLIRQNEKTASCEQQTDPLDTCEKFKYDKNSNLVEQTKRDGILLSFVYDNRNRLKDKIAPSETISFVYDTAGRRTKMTDGTGITSYAYYPLTGQIQKVTFPDFKNVSYDYYPKTYSLKTITDPFGIVSDYVYHKDRNLLKGVGKITGSSLRNEIDPITGLSVQYSDPILDPDVSYEYNKNGQLDLTQFRNGMQQDYSYKDNRLDKVIHKEVDGSTTNSFTYGYDNNGNITSTSTTSKGAPDKLYNYTYDKLNRIQTNSQFSENYTYDVKGNRLTLESEQLPVISEAQYEYDDWDRLTKVTMPNGDITSYQYNGDNLIFSRTKNGQNTRYYLDGDNIIAEGSYFLPQLYIQKASYVRGNGIALRKLNGTTSYYLTNGHGDVVDVRDGNGNSQNKYSYDIWGNPLTVTKTIDNPFMYSGEYFDETTNLQYLRARWYDPSVARFINEDTYEGQTNNPLSLNLYTYVSNNPLIHTDPTGHQMQGMDNASDYRYTKPLREMTPAELGALIYDPHIPEEEKWKIYAYIGVAYGVGATQLVETKAARLSGDLGKFSKWLTSQIKNLNKVNVIPTKDGLAQIKNHLTNTVDGMSFEPNKVMLSKIEGMLNSGKKLEGAYKDFYDHELTELKLMGEGFTYDKAHEMSLEVHGVLPQALYAPEVVEQMREWFNKLDFQYWNIK